MTDYDRCHVCRRKKDEPPLVLDREQPPVLELLLVDADMLLQLVVQ